MYPNNRSTDRARLDRIPVPQAPRPDAPPAACPLAHQPSLFPTSLPSDPRRDTLHEHPVHYDPAVVNRDTLSRIQARLLGDRGSELQDEDLLAYLLGPSPRVTVLEQARTLLDYVDGFHRLGAVPARRFTAIEGLTLKKAARLAAMLELARRLEARPQGPRFQVCTPADVAAVYGPRMRDLKQEVFRVLYLSTANVVLTDPILSRGGLAASIVEPRAVFKRAVLEDAAAVIGLHNHPSGNPEPSREDLRITRQLVETGKLMGIPLHDHVIIAGKTYTSLTERGLLT